MCEVPESSALFAWTLPNKTRHGHFAHVEITLAGILGDRLYPLEDGPYYSWRYDNTQLVVEKDVLFAYFVLFWSADCGDGV